MVEFFRVDASQSPPPPHLGHHQRRNRSHLEQLHPPALLRSERAGGADEPRLCRPRRPVRDRRGLLPVVRVTRGPAERRGLGQREPAGAAAPEEQPGHEDPGPDALRAELLLLPGRQAEGPTGRLAALPPLPGHR